MFSFHKLEIVHWDWWERFTLPLDAGIVTVVGPNGSGKTTLLDALRTLLAIPCSQGRDYKRYVRRADRPYAWLRATVSNPRRSQGYSAGQLAFWPITDPVITLFCRIRKKGGDWQRDYGIGAGDISVEQAESGDAVTWFGVRQYEAQLENAGLTRAIKRVLALDQGHTDKLCEYSGRQLLELVFDVFGDQDVLDNYRKAREDQIACKRELDELNTQLARLHTQLQAAEADVNSYQDYQNLIGELADLSGQWLPRLELAGLADSLRGGHSQLLGKRREFREIKQLLAKREQARAQLVEQLAAAEREEAEAQQALNAAQEAEKRVDRPLARAGLLLEQRQKLAERAAQQAEGVDIDQATRETERLRRRIFEAENQQQALDDERTELRARIAALDAGRRPMPAEVQHFRAALDQAGLRHTPLADIVEITDERWQAAVEAVLAGVRQLILLEDPADRAAAWRLGEQLKFRHYLVPDRAPPPRPTPGSLLECLRFSADPPAWLAKLLDGIRRVDTVADGAKLPEHQAWITPSGYQRERRGARDISVADAFFGRNAAAQARTRLAEVETARAALAETLSGHVERLAAVQARMAGVDAARELTARAPEFERAEAEYARLNEEAQTLKSQRAEAAVRYHTAIEAAKPLTGQHALTEDQIGRDQKHAQSLAAELHSTRRAYVDNVLAWRRLRRDKPLVWRSAAGLAEARAQYESATTVEREIDRLTRKKNDGRYITDGNCVQVRDKLNAEHRQLAGRIDNQGVHLERAQHSTDLARGQYVNVLRATLRRYAQNLKSLGALAGIEVEAQHPHLTNDDLSLAQANLEVQFNFDQKGLIGLNDGEASGGQQVMKSMILLIGLMMEDDKSGGFVFIDEPFAHLDIFNIDKVGAFLQATKAQYIVTTPNTHNVNVFKPSELTLVTQKRRPGGTFAPPVAFLRRATDPA